MNIFNILTGIVENKPWKEEYKEIWDYYSIMYFLSMYPNNLEVLNILQGIVTSYTKPEVTYQILQNYIPYYNTRYNFIKLDKVNFSEREEIARATNIPYSDIKYLKEEEVNHIKKFLLRHDS